MMRLLVIDLSELHEIVVIFFFFQVIIYSEKDGCECVLSVGRFVFA